MRRRNGRLADGALVSAALLRVESMDCPRSRRKARRGIRSEKRHARLGAEVEDDKPRGPTVDGPRFFMEVSMLVLSRKRGEKLIVTLPDGRKIEIVVGKVAGQRVTLAIDAPRDVPVKRSELVAA